MQSFITVLGWDSSLSGLQSIQHFDSEYIQRELLQTTFVSDCALGLTAPSGSIWSNGFPPPPLPGIPLFLNLFNFIEEHSQLLVVLSQALFALWSSVFSRSWGLEHLLLLQAHANELLIIIFHRHPPDYSTEFITRPAAAHWSSYDRARCTPPRKCDGTTLCT